MVIEENGTNSIITYQPVFIVPHNVETGKYHHVANNIVHIWRYVRDLASQIRYLTPSNLDMDN